MVDHSRKSGVTFNVISAHSNFSEDIQIERMDVMEADGRNEAHEEDESLRKMKQ